MYRYAIGWSTCLLPNHRRSIRLGFTFFVPKSRNCARIFKIEELARFPQIFGDIFHKSNSISKFRAGTVTEFLASFAKMSTHDPTEKSVSRQLPYYKYERCVITYVSISQPHLTYRIVCMFTAPNNLISCHE